MEERLHRRSVRLFVLVLICTALATGLGSNIFSNYFKEAFLVDSVQRGFLEIPRESPGILCMVFVAALGWLGNLRLSILAQLLSLVGLTVMGLFSPSYGVMMVFLLIQSLGMHLFMPLSDAISMELAREGEVGATFGRFKGVSTFATMAAACVVFFGFRYGAFSFTSAIIWPFALAAAATAVAVGLLLAMLPGEKSRERVKNQRVLFRKSYTPYYLVTLAYGCQKRIKIVFAPWVIIELLGEGADTVALLTIATYFAGTLAAPWIGRMLDRLGVRAMLRIEGGYIALSFCMLGLLAGMLSTGLLSGSGCLSWLVYGAYILCVLFEQFNLVHSYMMRSIAQDPSEVTRTLSVGLSIDHVMAILASPILGLVWSMWGVQWVFYLSALSGLLQLFAAHFVEAPQPTGTRG